MDGDESADEADAEDTEDVNVEGSEAKTGSKRRRTGSSSSKGRNTASISSTSGKKKFWWKSVDAWFEDQYKRWGQDVKKEGEKKDKTSSKKC